MPEGMQYDEEKVHSDVRRRRLTPTETGTTLIYFLTSTFGDHRGMGYMYVRALGAHIEGRCSLGLLLNI